MKGFLDKVAKMGKSFSQLKDLPHMLEIQEKHKDKLIPIYELLIDYD